MLNSARVCIILLLAASGIAQARTCAFSTVSVDTGSRTIRWDLEFPKDVGELRLDSGNYPDQINWTVDPAAARLQHGVLVRARPTISRVTLTATLLKNLQHQDRVYPPAIIFDDHSIALLSSLFNFSADHDKLQCTTFVAPPKSKVGTGDKWGRLTVDDDPLVPGYVVFGTPRVFRSNGLTLVLDKGVPPWAKKKIASTLNLAVPLYAEKIGPQILPPVIIYTQNAGPTSHWGDRLPGSITLGLFGKDWEVQSQQLESELTRFVAHEVFHVWNGQVHFVDNGDSLLAVEGGAELASVFVLASAEAQPAPFVLSKVSAALNQCQFDLAYGNSLHQLLLSPHPGMVPYQCGMVIMFAATAAPNVTTAVGDRFFTSWKSILSGGSRKMHFWSDLTLEPRDQKKIEDLDEAIIAEGEFVRYIKMALAKDGYEVARDDNLSPTIKKQLATVIMAHLMQIDCAGAVSFWPKDGGFLIDPNIKTCRTLHPGALVTSFIGKKPWDEPVVLVAKIRSLCNARSAIPVGYGAGADASLVACTEQFPDIPVPVRITRK